jgi:periplasmic protein TonB
MMDPKRLLDEEPTSELPAMAHHGLKLALLRAAKADAPPPEARQQMLSALGLGAEIVSAAGAPMSGVRRARASEWRDKAPLFASVLLSGGGAARRRFVPAAAVSTLAHAALFALLFFGGVSVPTPTAEQRELTLKIQARRRAQPAFAGAPRAELSPPREPSPSLKPDAVGAWREGERERTRAGGAAPPSLRPAEQAAIDPASAPAPVATGEAQAPGELIAAPPPLPSDEVLPFGEGMSRPRWIEGPEPEYPRAAREAKVRGTMLVKCVITTTGALRDCQILKSLPFLDQPVLAALARQRYTPVTFQGRTINVEYVIPLKFELP